MDDIYVRIRECIGMDCGIYRVPRWLVVRFLIIQFLLYMRMNIVIYIVKIKYDNCKNNTCE